MLDLALTLALSMPYLSIVSPVSPLLVIATFPLL